MNRKKARSKEEDSLESSYAELKSSIFDFFGALEDPRQERNRRHKLIDIIFITICSVIGGANNLKEVVMFAHSKRSWFQTILCSENKMPSYSTFWWFFVLLNSKLLNTCFINWAQSLAGSKLGQSIAIDGKSLRGTRTEGNKSLHIVSVWASDLHLTLAHERVESKTNEITVIPQVLESLDIKGTTVTIDAMGCQKEIAELITGQQADYILALKGNQGLLHDELINFFEQAIAVDFEGVKYDQYEEKSKSHGREEKRMIFVSSDIDWLPQKSKWKGLKTVAMVLSERIVKGKVTSEKRYYISSHEAKAKALAKGIRSHWSIENSCHWILDVAFREDDLKGRTGYLGENMSLMRRVALNLLKQDTTTKAGIAAKRKKAGWGLSYLESLLSVKSLL